jgi:hypothetical protein
MADNRDGPDKDPSSASVWRDVARMEAEIVDPEEQETTHYNRERMRAMLEKARAQKSALPGVARAKASGAPPSSQTPPDEPEREPEGELHGAAETPAGTPAIAAPPSDSGADSGAIPSSPALPGVAGPTERPVLTALAALASRSVFALSGRRVLWLLCALAVATFLFALAIEWL